MALASDSSGSQHRRVDEERVRQLLAAGGESWALDYKSELHPDDKRQLLALAKDVGAMAARGGDIVVGADETGATTGRVSEHDREQFDEARLRDKLKRYLGPRVALRTGVHDIDGQLVAIVAVEPHPLGVCMMAADGNHEAGSEFRTADVFVRRGTQSVRWSETEVAEFIERTREQQRESVRVEVREEWQSAMGVAEAAAAVRRAPVVATSWALDLDTLVETVLQDLRQGDEVALRRLLVGLTRETALAARGPRGIERSAELLDRAVALVAEMVVIHRDDLFGDILRRLAASYETALVNEHPASAVRAPVLGLMMLERLYAVGALLVRDGRLDLVRAVATQAVRSRRGEVPFLIANIQRQARRGNFMHLIDGGRPLHTWVLSRAAEAADRNHWLVPDMLGDDDRLTTSLCEFDVLCELAAMSTSGGPSSRLVFGNFAGWFSERTDPIVAELLDRSSGARAAIFPQDDQALADALRLIEHSGQAGWGSVMPPWDGFEDERIRRFLGAHPAR